MHISIEWKGFFFLFPEVVPLFIPNEALASNCFLLSAVAFRTIVEAVCRDKGIKIKEIEYLKPQIDKLLKNGLITKSEAGRLLLIRFIGNDSVHEMVIPKQKDVNSP